jgi:hypothetical protein
MQWLPEASLEDPAAVEALRETGLALARFVRRAMNAYPATLSQGGGTTGRAHRPTRAQAPRG